MTTAITPAPAAVTVETCRVCTGATVFLFHQVVLGRRVAYFDCPACGYVQTESPHWLEEAYSQAINDLDTGIMVRNLVNVGRIVMTLLALKKLHARVVDEAGGYGILVRLLRDAGVDAYWSDKYCENLLARGFEADDSPCELLTACEVFEHFVAPVEELRAMLARAPTVFLTTELISTREAPKPDWWYLSPQHGQHIGFFRVSTLKTMAQMLGCHFRTDGRSVHLFSRQPIAASWRIWLRARRGWRIASRLTLQPKTTSDLEFLRELHR